MILHNYDPHTALQLPSMAWQELSLTGLRKHVLAKAQCCAPLLALGSWLAHFAFTVIAGGTMHIFSKQCPAC